MPAHNPFANRVAKKLQQLLLAPFDVHRRHVYGVVPAEIKKAAITFLKISFYPAFDSLVQPLYKITVRHFYLRRPEFPEHVESAVGASLATAQILVKV